MTLRTISSLGSLSGKTVIVRCDLNVPMSDGEITDDGRIRASVPTIRELTDAGAKVVVISHLGRPDGTPDATYSLAPAASRLGSLLGQDVSFATDTVGTSAISTVAALGNGQVAVLENLRFNPGETAKSDSGRLEFATALAEFGDAFVSDGFGVVQRKQVRVYELVGLLPSDAGSLIAAEIDVVARITEIPAKPYSVVP